MKEFNLELAKQGKPVCTRDGRKARILCFDLKDKDFPISAAVELESDREIPMTYTLNGSYLLNEEDNRDLMMVSEKHEGWINITKCEDIKRFVGGTIHPSEEAAKEDGKLASNNYITTIKIEWEE